MTMTISPAIAQLFTTASNPDQLLTKLMPALCHELACDRCFLYLRNPDTRNSQITHCYSVDSQWPDLRGAPKIEPADVGTQDPLMAIAFRTPEAVFVDDIETAGPEVVNLDYEREEFGHRALIHAPIYYEGKLLGILEPCVFEEPREWTEGDRALTAAVQEKLSPVVMEYLSEIEL